MRRGRGGEERLAALRGRWQGIRRTEESVGAIIS
jgi:hypothetical protein